jgi:diguanylate cyclase (GGDEF)-like protein
MAAAHGASRKPSRTLEHLHPAITLHTAPRLSAAVACLALVLLAVAPILFQRQTTRIRAEITGVHEPAREAVRDITMSLAREVAAVRGLLVGGLPELRDEYAGAVAVEMAAHARLVVLAARLDRATAQESRITRVRIEEWRALNDGYVRGNIPGSAVVMQLGAQQARYNAALNQTARLDSSVRMASARVQAHIQRVEGRWALTSVLLAVLAGISGIGVALMMRTALAEARLARSDALTGLLNRRGFNEILHVEIARASRFRNALTALTFDLDGFKVVNDRQGHATGDRLLQDVAQALQGAVRSIDVVARLGGDEFAALLPDNRLDQPVDVVLQVRQRILTAIERRGWDVTLSVGAVTIDGGSHDASALLVEADRAMYEAKRAGKNTIRHTDWRGAIADV